MTLLIRTIWTRIESFTAVFRKARVKKEVVTKRYIRKDGRAVWFRVRVRVVHDPSHQSPRILGTVEDITESRRAQQTLEESESRLTLFVDSIPTLALWPIRMGGSSGTTDVGTNTPVPPPRRWKDGAGNPFMIPERFPVYWSDGPRVFGQAHLSRWSFRCEVRTASSALL